MSFDKKPNRLSANPAPFSKVGLAVSLFGAGASVFLVLRVGQRNSSLLLMTLFVVWVGSPFVGAIWANARSRYVGNMSRAVLVGGTSIMALMSVGIY